MRDVVRWVLELDRPLGESGGTLAPLVRLLTDHTDPATALAATADGCDITLDWLLADANTLYLSAPLGD